MNGGEDAAGKVTKLVPKGTSAYQAAWIVDEEDEYSDVDEDEEGQDMMEDDDENVEPAGADSEFPSFDDDEEYELIDMNGKEKTEEDDEFDAEEEDRQ
jgi:pre-rRNA-processing protein TSR1